MKIISVVGARPNFMKMAPIDKEIRKHNSEFPAEGFKHIICHTGQHYDMNMSDVFFYDLELPKPEYYLNVGSGSHAEQTAKIMIEFEKVLFNEKPDIIIVYGDVNSTIACSLVAAKLGIKIVHVEAGLRSFDREMPEEINRVLTDHLADYLFVTEKAGIKNLDSEGIPQDKMFFVGNVMIDSLIYYLPRTVKSNIMYNLELQPSSYLLVTLHRPSNVDNPENITKILSLLNKLAEKRKIIFPVHPRARNRIKNNLSDFNKNLFITDPIGYIDFLTLMKNAELVLTDSGGIQEETTYLGVQCLTIRNNTERPVTVEIGTNQLAGTDSEKILQAAYGIINNGEIKKGSIPDLWDGKTSERIVHMISNFQ
ncbi:MAG: UDP-N-acetylglucosamine 2-epimerase (non-hydrolyzing) [Ignavibacteriaceae bacterium]|nr:UDP-N-acetylglucosamine 2-epimerase (non-hydrolyzing) [Ignavibacteriaceae bacterium]